MTNTYTPHGAVYHHFLVTVRRPITDQQSETIDINYVTGILLQHCQCSSRFYQIYNYGGEPSRFFFIVQMPGC